MTPRRLQVFQLLSEGCSAKEIGVKLKISTRTAEEHIRELRDYFKAKNTTHMMILAIRKGFIGIDL